MPNNHPHLQIPALVNQKLSHEAFQQISGIMAGYPFVKVVVDKTDNKIHFINNAMYSFHAEYIGENILGQTKQYIHDNIDSFNRSVYLSPDRRFFLGILAFHQRENAQFYTLETVEIDNMNVDMLMFFFETVKANVDPVLPLLFKPANHNQENFVTTMDATILPRIYNHELFASASFVPLNAGESQGRLRLFDEEQYRQQFHTIQWYDIIVMDRVPDDIPRVSGIINSQHTTPLSHTNVLACGWQIPNSTQVGIIKELQQQQWDRVWVKYQVEMNASKVNLEKIETPQEDLQKPDWTIQHIHLEEPEISKTDIKNIVDLRLSDRSRYGTKAAHLGELLHLLEHPSKRMIGYYRTPRPPRKDLICFLADFLKMPEKGDLAGGAWDFLRKSIKIPRGVAIPFSIQQEFLESYPKIQQTIGKLKMALELNAKEIDSICVQLQQMICKARFSDKLRDYIDSEIADHLGGTSSFVVRSSSNAEDLEDFSAAGIYESFNHVTTADKIFDSIKEVWSSLISPRSVRLRQQVGISLDDCYMGVIIQEEIPCDMGGVLVTTNPMNHNKDFRNVYINVSTRSAQEVVEGKMLPYQYLFNTLEGGGRTISMGNATQDLPESKKQILQRLAFAGRFLQSYFSKDYTFSSPVDIEWASHNNEIYILQLRPYAI